MTEEIERADGAPIEVHLRDYLRVVRKHAGIAAAFFLVVVAAVAVVTFRTPPVFRATATLSIERQGPQTYALEDLIAQESPQDEYRKTQQELIRSRPIVHETFEKMGLRSYEPFQDDQGEDRFRESILIAPREGTYLVDVSIESRDRGRVASWVNGLVDEYVRYMDLRYRTTSRQAEDRINRRIPELRGKLLESENAVTSFLKENNVVSFDKQLEILYRKLNTLESRLTSVETERIRLDAGYRVLAESQNGRTFPAHLPEVATSDVLKTLMRQEAALIESFAKVKAKYKPKHVRYIFAQQQLSGVQEKLRQEVHRIADDLAAQLDAKKREKEDLSRLIAAQRVDIGKLEAQSNKVKALQQEVESNRRMYEEFTERRKEIESATKLGRTEVFVVERARTPRESVRPKKWLNLTLAAVVGLLGGVALAFFIEYLDDSFKTPEEVETLDAPLLGVVQEIAPGPEEGDRDLVCLKHPKAPPAEAFRSIRTGLTFTQQAEGKEARTYLVTSSGPVEGKTLNAVNIALTMARADKKILLVDADMRKPALHKVLDIPDRPGLSSFFAGEAAFEDVVQPGPIENLSVVASGAIPPNPSELLGSPRLDEFLETCLGRFDRVIFDTPPAVAVTDSVVLASKLDGVIFVVRAERTGKRTASRSLDEFRRVGGKIAGVILNGFNARKAGYSRASYSSYYYYYRDRGGYGAYGAADGEGDLGDDGGQPASS
ncbi:MAG: GumC family protein [Planctomycetota bacterium]|jgi:capsular exopolysaccharide synthesis family protein